MDQAVSNSAALLRRGFSSGFDVFDCVCVINSHAFMDTRISLGGEVAIVAGPWGADGSIEWGAPRDKRFGDAPDGEKGCRQLSNIPQPPAIEVNGAPMKLDKETLPGGRRGSRPKMPSPVFSYVKSRDSTLAADTMAPS